MGTYNYAEYYRITTAPFAIDKTGENIVIKPFTRDIGVGSVEYVLKGRAVITENGKSFSVEEGDVFLLHTEQKHEYQPDPKQPWHKIWVQISGPDAPDLLRMFGLDKVNLISKFPLENEIRKIQSVINANASQETIDREGPRLLLELVQLLEKEVTARARGAARVSPAYRIRQIVKSNPTGDLSMDRMAQELHMSKQHLIRIFKQEYGVTPHQYVMDYRTSVAKSMLKETDLPIWEIAERLRFCDPSCFSAFFRKRTGLTPIEYRKKYGQN